ncbi:tRNA (guanosine(46)-N7)-methyltransferase TrmB [Balneola sp. MJW-20]|uniref:tRNA (guanosine(46)-N7)-methyltransferase TrmB n=1 Tax=Gracilimonas aurantiaca TaxID=3234185 RepID=UPI0034677C7C
MPEIKEQRYEDMQRLPNVIEYSEYGLGPTPLIGKWGEKIFQNDQPIVLELACGKGEYSLGLSEIEPDRNYVGVDIKGNRMWVGATKALEHNLENIRFLRAFIGRIEDFFGKNEVDEIWIIFPDPQLKKERKRLTSPMFLQKYREILKKGGSINLKTDSTELYEYTKEVIAEKGLCLKEDVEDVYRDRPDDIKLGIKTYYEGMHLDKGRTIRFLSFTLTD